MKKWIFIALLICVVLPAANVIISPNMNLPVPVVSQDPGPDWANNINSCMGAIDSHDHTPGKGVPISSQAINITSDLPLNDNSLTSAKSVVFSSQASFGTNQSLYVETPDLFYNDGNGNIIRITQSGSVSGASGTITGLPSGTASASYQSVGGTFQFQSATNTPANISGASITVAPQSVSPNAITIKSPNPLSASYNFTLPTSVPSFSSLLSMSTSGVLSTAPASAPAYTSLLSMSTGGVLSTVPYKIPTVQTFTSSSGTYTAATSPSPIYIRVRIVGGGGGGAGSALSSVASGSDGVDSTFSVHSGSAILTASKGIGGTTVVTAGGGATINSPAYGTKMVGGQGSGVITSNTSGFPCFGAVGGNSFFGGGGGGGAQSNIGGTAGTNTGSGGGGAGQSAVVNGVCGGAGSAAGFIDAIIPSPSASYDYVVGTAGAGGVPGATGFNGGSGAAGYIEVTEYYQ